jgi:hypothetical protein
MDADINASFLIIPTKGTAYLSETATQKMKNLVHDLLKRLRVWGIEKEIDNDIMSFKHIVLESPTWASSPREGMG